MKGNNKCVNIPGMRLHIDDIRARFEVDSSIDIDEVADQMSEYLMNHFTDALKFTCREMGLIEKHDNGGI